MIKLEVHATATLSATPVTIIAPTGSATAPGVNTRGLDSLTILVTNTGSNPVTAAVLKRSLDPTGTRFSPADTSVAIPGGSLAAGASWEISWGTNLPPSYWTALALTSSLGTTVSVDFLGHNFSEAVN